MARCGDSTPDCACDVNCTDRAQCCSDYKAVCLSCKNRCSDSKVEGAPCQCHSGCHSEDSCCEDRAEICEAPAPNSPISDEDLRELTEDLWRTDYEKLREKVELSLQGHTSQDDVDDVADAPLFTKVDDSIFNNDIVIKFLAMQDNYEKEVSIEEEETAEEVDEKNKFLSAVAATGVMGRLKGALKQYDLMNQTKSMEETLDELWFTTYSRAGDVQGSSGFEHVFFGELKGDTVLGFHNWIIFYKEEKHGNLNYKGYIEYTDAEDAGLVLTSRFTWLNKSKPIGGGTIAISLELELALNTLCFLARPDSLCHVQTNGHRYDIQTYRQNDQNVVATAYPVVSGAPSPVPAILSLWSFMAAGFGLWTLIVVFN